MNPAAEPPIPKITIAMTIRVASVATECVNATQSMPTDAPSAAPAAIPANAPMNAPFA